MDLRLAMALELEWGVKVSINDDWGRRRDDDESFSLPS